jgi:uncharacterized protein YbjT (DUF2867 family)
MHVLLLGASGFIGSAIAARLKSEGVRVTAIGRGTGASARRITADRWVRLDLRKAVRPEDWLLILDGVDAVVNAAGVLQDSGRDSTRKVHVDAPTALYAACERAGVRRIVHISAMGAGEEGLTRFSETKREADAALMETGLEWVILRPSVVLGRQAYGGSALLRGLAALPVLPVLAGAGRIQVVQLDEVAETVARLLRPDAPNGLVLDLAGPDALTFEEVVELYRHWLGWAPARLIRLPEPIMRLACRAGDLVAWLGWRPPIRTTTRREMVRGATGNPSRWMEVTGIVPRSLGDALAAEPASAQERWFARLFLLKPLAIGIFALFWLATGLIALGPGREEAIRLTQATAAASIAQPLVIGGALFDIAMGIALMLRPTIRPALIVAFLGTLGYMLAGTLLMPSLWADPLGRLTKILPILALNLVCLAILDDR